MADRADNDKKKKTKEDRERIPSRLGTNTSSAPSKQDRSGGPAPPKPSTEGSEPPRRPSSKDRYDQSRQSSRSRDVANQRTTEVPHRSHPTNTAMPLDKGKKHLDPEARRFSPAPSESASQQGRQLQSGLSATPSELSNPKASLSNVMEATTLLRLRQVAFVTDLPPNVDQPTFSGMMARLGPIVVAELRGDQPAVVIWQSPRITFDAVKTLLNEDWGQKRVFAWVADPDWTSRQHVAEWLFRGASSRQDWGTLRVYDPVNLIQAEELEKEFRKYCPGQSQLQLKLNGRRTGMAFVILKSDLRAHQVVEDYIINMGNRNRLQVGVEGLRLDAPYLTGIKPRFILMAKNIFVGLEPQMHMQVVPDFTINEFSVPPTFMLLRDEKRKWRGTVYMTYQTAADRDLAVNQRDGTMYFNKRIEVSAV